MNTTAFLALVRRDLQLFFTDRRAVIMSFVAPILIGSFFGYLFGGVADRGPSRIAVTAIDGDRSAISQRLVTALAGDKALEVKPGEIEPARAAVRSGKTTVAAVIPKGFGDQSARSFFRGGEKPEIQLMFDPSHATEMAMVRGILTQHVMEVVSAEVFGAGSERYLEESLGEAQNASGMASGDRASLEQMLKGVMAWNRRASAQPRNGAAGGLGMPFSVREEAITARKGVEYNAYGHAFAGMSVQFVLMMGVDAGLLMILHRRSGIWRRLRAAPLSRFEIIGSRVTSAAAIAVIVLFVVFAFARLVFHVRVEGSLAGFVGVCVAFALTTASFGLLVAVSGKTVEATRGLAILATLLLVMLGGAWVPAFVFPAWLQKASFAVPTRWAVDGLDGMTWRGLGLDAAVPTIAALLGFALLFGGLAIWRFRWDAE